MTSDENTPGGWAREMSRAPLGPTLAKTLDAWKALFNLAIDSHAVECMSTDAGREDLESRGARNAYLHACTLIEAAIGERYAQPLTATRTHIVATWDR